MNPEKIFKDLEKAKDRLNQVVLEAVRIGNVPLLKEALARGADPNVKRYKFNESTAVHEAALSQNPEIIATLVAAGGDVKKENGYDLTAEDYVSKIIKPLGALEAMTAAINEGLQSRVSKDARNKKTPQQKSKGISIS